MTVQEQVKLVNDPSLNQAGVDSIFKNLAKYFYRNPPQSDCVVNLSGGANASPTDGKNNRHISYLEKRAFARSGHKIKIKVN